MDAGVAAATPGEAHRQVVDRLEVPAGGPGHVGLVALEVEDVADRVGARRRRRAPAVADPAHARPAASYPATGPPMTCTGVGPPRVSDHSWQGPDGHAVGVDRHGAGPLPGARHGDHPARVDHARPRAPRRAAAVMRSHHVAGVLGGRRRRARPRVATGRCSVQAMAPVSDTRPTLGPPVPRSTARTQRSSRGRSPVAAGHRAAEVVPAGDAAGQASAGIACWASIIWPITMRMNSSASSVMPPATPP